jgi:hypothetical protein
LEFDVLPRFAPRDSGIAERRKYDTVPAKAMHPPVSDDLLPFHIPEARDSATEPLSPWRLSVAPMMD